METLVGYSEAALCIRETEEVAILLAFGYRLMSSPYLVGEWAYEFKCKEDFLTWQRARKNGGNTAAIDIVETATWNLACAEGKSAEQAGVLRWAYRYSHDHDTQLVAELSALGLEPAKAQRLRQIVQCLIVEMCREVLGQYEGLVDILRNKPRNALWIVVRDPQDNKRFAKFGANASNRTIEECLNAL